MADCCTRVFLKTVPSLQPQFRRPSGEVVCEACSQCCCSDATKVRPAPAEAITCSCTGSGFCIFEARFNETVSPTDVAAVRAELAKPLLSECKFQTRQIWRTSSQITNLPSAARLIDQRFLSEKCLPQIPEPIRAAEEKREAQVSLLLQWFSETFTYETGPMVCCEAETTFINTSAPITPAELTNMAINVDVYQCSRCKTYKRRPNIMDPQSLFGLQKGSRPQGAAIFAGVLCALGFESRVVYDRRDFTLCWVEYARLGQDDAWHHVDPFHRIFDQPQNVAKEIPPNPDFILAVDGDFCFTDVTSTYCRDPRSEIVGAIHCETFLELMNDHANLATRRISPARKEVRATIERQNQRQGDLRKAQQVKEHADSMAALNPDATADYLRELETENALILRETLDNDSPVPLFQGVSQDPSTAKESATQALKNWPAYLLSTPLRLGSSLVQGTFASQGEPQGLEIFQALNPLGRWQELLLFQHDKKAVYAEMYSAEKLLESQICALSSAGVVVGKMQDYTSGLPEISRILVALVQGLDDWRKFARPAELCLVFAATLQSLVEGLTIALFGEVTVEDPDLCIAQATEILSVLLTTETAGSESTQTLTEVLSSLWGLEQYRPITAACLQEPCQIFKMRVGSCSPTMEEILKEFEN